MAKPSNVRQVEYAARKSLQGRLRMKSRLEAARKQMENATDKCRDAIEGILVDAAKLVSKDPQFKDCELTARYERQSIPSFWLMIGGEYSLEAAHHPAIQEAREIVVQAEIDFGINVLPNVTVRVRNGKLVE